MAKLTKKDKLNHLHTVLTKHKIPESYYSLNGMADSALCLEDKGHDVWEVYVGDRGQKIDKRTFCDLDEACMIFLLNIDNKNWHKMFREYQKLCLNQATK